MTTAKGEKRRQALVDAAVGLLADGGFDAVRHRAVADRAGLPLASTTYYFQSLEDLVTAAVAAQGRAELARGRAALDASPDGSPVELVLDLLLGPDAAAAAVLGRYERLVATARRPHLRPLMLELGAELRALVGQTLARAGVATGPGTVERLIALVDGAVVNALIEVDPDPRSAARAMLRDALG